MLDILYVMDPMEGVNVSADTTFVFQEEAQARGHRNYHALITDLTARDGVPVARCRPVLVDRGGAPPFSFGDEMDRPLAGFDCVMMRKDPPFNMRYVYATYLLEEAAAETFVMNDPKSLRDANEKLYTFRFPELVPPSIVTASQGEILAFLDAQGGEGVIKPLDGAGGEGVLLLGRDDRNHKAIIEMSTQNGQQFVMVQAYIPEILTTGDHRIILLDGEPLGGVARLPQDREFRGNIHVGGRCEKMTLTHREEHICEVLGPKLRADGLHFVGIDVIGDWLTEVNVTSPTGIQEINALDGVKLEADVIDFVERRCA